jgi:twitching motility protein PilT
MNQPIYEIPEGDIAPLSPRRAAQAAADARALMDATPPYTEPPAEMPPAATFSPPLAPTQSYASAPPPGSPSLASAPPFGAIPFPNTPPATVSFPNHPPTTPSFASAPPPSAASGAPLAYIPIHEPSDPYDLEVVPQTHDLLEQALADISFAPPPVMPAHTDIDDDYTVGEGQTSPRLHVDPDLIAALTDVLYSGASDLHVTVNAPPMIRVDGALRQVEGTQVWNRTKVMGALLSILTPAQRAAFDRELELDLAYTLSANARFRVNIYQQRNAMGAAFRLIPTEIRQLKDLGVPDTIARFATLPRGLVLVTGPTGSGKSTTLAALIDLVNRTRTDHIVTVEDPIEFMHQNRKSLINQREVGSDTHSFANALKHVLRQDPDVILIGELRDLETISVALTAAETGHLVFATLHTQDAAQTIDRVIDVFPPHQQGQVRSQLAAVLQGVVCQTLVKRASGTGRVVATEVLIATPAINNLIREGKTYQIASAMQAGRDYGMHTMDAHLADLANAGEITVAAAMEKAQDPASLQQLIHRLETPADAAARAMAATGIDFGDAYSRTAE